MKEKFIEIYKEKIKRPGADKLLQWLEQVDMFTAPASTRYHLAEDGGLCKHSVHVYERLRTLVEKELAEDGKLTPELEETVAIVGLLHDVCKVGFYKKEMRNKKDDNGKWIQVPTYAVDDKLPFGHGEKSVYVIMKFMGLKTDEAMAIRWHMGFSDQDFKAGGFGVSNAFTMSKLAVLAHIADLQATYFDEGE